MDVIPGYPDRVRGWLLLLLIGCGEAPELVRARTAQATLLPLPVSLHADDGGFHFTPATTMKSDFAVGALAREVTGQPLPDGEDLTIALDTSLPPEGYRLQVGSAIRIRAADFAGALYALQTLRQLLVDGWVAGVDVQDQPRFAWRGLMIDVARHFFAVDELRRYVDLAARYKLNRLHLHLTDDQGWRIEIKAWPDLTRIGGATAVNGDPGGFYTQSEYADLVAYAAARAVTVVPEIDVPGHSNAALSAYGALSCDGMATTPYTGTEVGISALCANDMSRQLLDDVFGELAALQPGGFVHVGGDEARMTSDADYLQFMTRVHDLVVAHGLQMIGWEELAKANVPATLQLWLGGNVTPPADTPVILSPATHAYLDMKYDSQTPYGTSWVGFVDVDTAYEWDPNEFSGRVIGVEAALWTEKISGRDQADYMLFPRLLGHAEIGWSPQASRSFADYRRRLGAQNLDGVAFYRSPLVEWREKR